MKRQNTLRFVAGTLEDGVALFGRPVLGGFERKGEFNTLSADGVPAAHGTQ